MGLQGSPFIEDGWQAGDGGCQGLNDTADGGTALQGRQWGAVHSVGSAPEARQGDHVGRDVRFKAESRLVLFNVNHVPCIHLLPGARCAE